MLRGNVEWEWTLKRLDKMCKGGNILWLGDDKNNESAEAALYGLSLALLDGFSIDCWFPYRDTRTQMVLAIVSGDNHPRGQQYNECIADSIGYNKVCRRAWNWEFPKELTLRRM